MMEITAIVIPSTFPSVPFRGNKPDQIKMIANNDRKKASKFPTFFFIFYSLYNYLLTEHFVLLLRYFSIKSIPTMS